MSLIHNLFHSPTPEVEEPQQLPFAVEEVTGMRMTSLLTGPGRTYLAAAEQARHIIGLEFHGIPVDEQTEAVLMETGRIEIFVGETVFAYRVLSGLTVEDAADPQVQFLLATDFEELLIQAERYTPEV